MIITDVRVQTKSGDVILVGYCRGIQVDYHEKTLAIREPFDFLAIPGSGEPVGDVKHFTAQICRYAGRPGAYLLVQATDPVEWLPGWSPVS